MNHSDSDDDFRETTIEIYEWLGLVSMGSPRVQAGDTIDPFLSRYAVPVASSSSAAAAGNKDQDEADLNAVAVTDMVSLTWRGLIRSTWIRLLLILLK